METFHLIVLTMEENAVDKSRPRFCMGHSVNCTVLSSEMRLGDHISPLYAVICGLLLPWGIGDIGELKKE